MDHCFTMKMSTNGSRACLKWGRSWVQGRVKPKTIQLVFVASQLSIQL